MNRLTMVITLAMVFGMYGCVSQPATKVHNQDTAADAEFEAGAKRKPTAKTMYALAKILATQGRDAEAEVVLNRAIAADPRFLPAYCAMAELQMRQRHIEKAIQVITDGLKQSPSEPILINDLGMCQLVNGDPGAALTAFICASGLAPDDHRYRSNMATALGLLGRYDEAMDLYLEVLSPADAHYNLGVLCEARHDDRRAKWEYQRSAELTQVDKQRRKAQLAERKKLDAATADSSAVSSPDGN